MNLLIDLEKREEVLCVRLVGELDHHAAVNLRERVDAALSENNLTHVLLNLEKLTFMDSSGLGVVLGRYKRVQAMGGEMVVCCISPQVKRLFELSGIYKIVSITSNEREGLSSLGVVAS
ncbi:anti-sigma F factor antagonist [Salipaludibacillus neizhouensis]|uniref:Anti-sigma F factor antagonist n=1 Tax=Salipaludibacillus neizhouensis TaxID=885475 RepID=A0A3A9K830_9BACI|nr:anti-sigma F factor antagonist [Salipaludibacillus neizhouensis]RKL67658.1 anti-sigma F factor antagonist [Salipaludibacillus neizhouensis]